MSSFFGRLRPSASSATPSTTVSPAKKDPAACQSTALESLLAADTSPIRADGSDKFFGFENFGSTCYFNSIIQCLYYSRSFREQVINFPVRSRPHPIDSTRTKQAPSKRSMLKVGHGYSEEYGMPESLFTSLKDLFEAIIAHESRVGVVNPQRFLEVLRRENEMFRSPMHQDAHEFLNLLLNKVVENVDDFSRQQQHELDTFERGRRLDSRLAAASAHAPSNAAKDGATTTTTSSVGWVHSLFEGTLTSETRCLTCENVSQRDEPFLDLSVDLEHNSSVTSCLKKFSAEEMLCKRNKFHCDKCGGLQEAEKRMKVKRPPRILALHLKRFKYTDDMQPLQKVFHRVVYPYYLRLFNTTDDAEDPDRLYELYAVVVHIGSHAYHGHYVSIIKTEDRGWLLFDDQIVEPVDKCFVKTFFGDENKQACAYVLFYQQTTEEAMRKEQQSDPLSPVEDGVGVPVESKTDETLANGHVRKPETPATLDEVTPSRDPPTSRSKWSESFRFNNHLEKDGIPGEKGRRASVKPWKWDAGRRAKSASKAGEATDQDETRQATVHGDAPIEREATSRHDSAARQTASQNAGGFTSGLEYTDEPEDRAPNTASSRAPSSTGSEQITSKLSKENGRRSTGGLGRFRSSSIRPRFLSNTDRNSISDEAPPPPPPPPQSQNSNLHRSKREIPSAPSFATPRWDAEPADRCAGGSGTGQGKNLPPTPVEEAQRDIGERKGYGRFGMGKKMTMLGFG